MQEINFNTLLNQYRSGNLIPIIGGELLKITTMDNRKLSLEDYITENITESEYKFGTSPKNLSELALKHPALNNNEIMGIYNSIQPEQFDIELLKLLAKPNGFKFYISTTYDRKLEELFKDSCESIIWNHEKKEPLYVNLENNLKKIVYLFGRIKNIDEDYEDFSFTDEDKLESLYNLSLSNFANKSTNKEKYSLLEYLRGKTLLFIGNDFEDWFMRFTIRTLYNRPYRYNPSKAYIINDTRKRISYQDYFFKKYEIKIVHDFPIEKFVRKLYEVIQTNEKFVDRFMNKKVFISYDRTDIEMATRIHGELRRIGINSWIDTRSIAIGEFGDEIKNEILSGKTCIFICLLSKNLIDKEYSESYVKRIEWKLAENRVKANEILNNRGDVTDKFAILPIAIDDFNQYSHELPEFIKKNNIYNLDDSRLFNIIETYLN